MRTSIEHPGKFIGEAAARLIRDEAFEAEQLRTLTDKQLEIIRQHNWFNLYVPKNFRGLEMSIPDILRIEEGLSWADGSCGWVVTLCSGAAWFVGFLDPGLSNELFESDEICFAGSGSVTGVANLTKDLYDVNGYWPFATGSAFASVFTVNCVVKENGTQLYHASGSPLVKSFLLKKEEVKVHYTWTAMGMIATGSHSFEVKSAAIPLNRSFVIDPAHASQRNPIFQFPFLQLAETTLVVNLSGMACRFVDICEELLVKKENNLISPRIAEVRKTLDLARSNFYNVVDTGWDKLVSRSHISSKLLQQLSRESHSLANVCRGIVNELYAYCGLEAADTRNEINRVWRNFHTAGQHSLFRATKLQGHKENLR